MLKSIPKEAAIHKVHMFHIIHVGSVRSDNNTSTGIDTQSLLLATANHSTPVVTAAVRSNQTHSLDAALLAYHHTLTISPRHQTFEVLVFV